MWKCDKARRNKILACQRRHAYKLRTQLIESGHYQCRGGYKFLRKYLIRRFGEKCSECGSNERNDKTGKVPIEVEHIDGDWQNNRLSNLILLCPNCHALTPTFRGLNRGRGRAYRLGGRDNPIKSQPRAAARLPMEREVSEEPPMQQRLLLPT